MGGLFVGRTVVLAMEESGADGGVVFLGRGHGWLLRGRCVLAVAEMAIVNFIFVPNRMVLVSFVAVCGLAHSIVGTMIFSLKKRPNCAVRKNVPYFLRRILRSSANSIPERLAYGYPGIY